MISQIAALSSNHIIWHNNTLPWHYPEDFKHFKKMTTGKIIVMWRKTFESIWKPLPNRHNIVLTRDTSWTAEGVTVMHDYIKLVETYQNSPDEIMIIWWEEIYRLFLPFSDTLYLTEVKKVVEWDTSFPIFKERFEEIRRDIHEEFDFVLYKRNASQETKS